MKGSVISVILVLFMIFIGKFCAGGVALEMAFSLSFPSLTPFLVSQKPRCAMF